MKAADRRPLLLVTGFGRFPRVPRNPSALLAEAVAASPRLQRAGIACRSLVLPTAYAAIEATLLPEIARLAPDAVLMLGVAARRREICIETIARNRVSRLFPDAEGRPAASLCFRAGAPAALHGRAASPSLLRALRSRNVPARFSRDAGRYLCNAAYYAALAAGGRGAGRTVFVHVPLPGPSRRPSLAEMEAALVSLAFALTRGLGAR